jgi:hypothetical protein
MIRTTDYKYARYFDASGTQPDQQEFYDLRPAGGDFSAVFNLPLELSNLSLWAEALRTAQSVPTLATPEQQAARTLLMNQLATLESTRLAPRAYAQSIPPENLKIEIKRWTDATLGAQAAVQITFVSRINTTYQMETSTDLVNWSDAGSPLAGNNGPVLMSDTLSGPRAFYRVRWSAAS